MPVPSTSARSVRPSPSVSMRVWSVPISRSRASGNPSLSESVSRKSGTPSPSESAGTHGFPPVPASSASVNPSPSVSAASDVSHPSSMPSPSLSSPRQPPGGPPESVGPVTPESPRRGPAVPGSQASNTAKNGTSARVIEVSLNPIARVTDPSSVLHLPRENDAQKAPQMRIVAPSGGTMMKTSRLSRRVTPLPMTLIRALWISAVAGGGRTSL